MNIKYFADYHWVICLRADVSLTEVEKLLNWREQGWVNTGGNDTYHSLNVALTTNIEVVCSKYHIEDYINAINNLGGDIRVDWYEPMPMYYISNDKNPDEIEEYMSEEKGFYVPEVHTDLNDAKRICESMNSQSKNHTYSVHSLPIK